MSDSIAIDYGDCFLRWSDIETVAEGQWLNDAVISFYFELIQTSSQLKTCDFWQPPAVEILSSLSEEELGPQSLPLLPPSATSAQCLVLPISDRYAARGHGQARGAAGTHWSLLVVGRSSSPQAGATPALKATHYDSLGPSMNSRAAKDIASRLHKVAGNTGAGGDLTFEESRLLQRQEGASDCGLYPLLLADGIARQQQLLTHNASSTVKDAGAQGHFDRGVAQLAPATVRHFRQELHAWLLRWAREAQESKGKPLRSLEEVEAVVGEMPRLFPSQR